MASIDIDEKLFARIRKIVALATTPEAFIFHAIEEEIRKAEAKLGEWCESPKSAEDVLAVFREIRQRSRPGGSLRDLINEGRRC